MTTLIIKSIPIQDLLLASDTTLDDNDRASKTKKLELSYTKIVLSPVFHTLKIWVGDKIEIQPPFIILELPIQEEND